MRFEFSLIGVIALLAIIAPVVGWIYNLVHILQWSSIAIANWTGMMLFELCGTFLGYGAILGWLEIFHIIQ